MTSEEIHRLMADHEVYRRIHRIYQMTEDEHQAYLNSLKGFVDLHCPAHCNQYVTEPSDYMEILERWYCVATIEEFRDA